MPTTCRSKTWPLPIGVAATITVRQTRVSASHRSERACEARLFGSLNLDNDQCITLTAFEQVLRENGLDKDDLRPTEGPKYYVPFPTQEALTRQPLCRHKGHGGTGLRAPYNEERY